ncbi:ABC transporter permease [Gracilibacillus sp. JCM 18860]|uniref:ABC transporter permease n=1 Tax=Gracilibacillus sp. JCM 18860 TaxID=1306159 RepID=UPI0006CFF0D0
MNYFLNALYAEGLKIRKSKVVWIIMAAFTIAPLMAGFFMFVLKSPVLAKNAGLLGAKAQIAGEASWPSYLSLLAQIISVGGILIFGFVTSWIFGREYADKTAKDLLALPYSRSIIVTAKFLIAMLTNFLLSIYIVCLGIFIGLMLGLPQWSHEIFTQGLYVLLVVTILTILLSSPVAFFACYSGGYLAPLGFVILTLVLSQIIAAAGFGDFFPWSIPAIYSGIAREAGAIGWNSFLIILATGLIGFLSTLYWWLFTDQHEG